MGGKTRQLEGEKIYTPSIGKEKQDLTFKVKNMYENFIKKDILTENVTVFKKVLNFLSPVRLLSAIYALLTSNKSTIRDYNEKVTFSINKYFTDDPKRIDTFFDDFKTLYVEFEKTRGDLDKFKEFVKTMVAISNRIAFDPNCLPED